VAPAGPASGPDGAPPEAGLRLELARQFVEAAFPGAILVEDAPPEFLLPSAEESRDRFLRLQRQTAALGLLPLLRVREGRPVLRLVPRPPPGRWTWPTNLALLLATIGTTLLAGYLQSLPLARCSLLDNALVAGLQFSLSVLLILGAHEMGHKIVAVRRGIDASLPYFLPMLPPIGTMGAVIVTRTPAPNRDSLMDLGASGPLAGFAAAIPVLVYGITHSFLPDPAALECLGRLDTIPDPLLIRWLMESLLHPASDAVVLGHPVLFAGWIGLVVTSINLLPAGMLDGGHAVRAALGARAHGVLSYVGLALAVLMGFYPMAIIIALLIRRGHVGPLDDLSPMSPSRQVVGVALLVVFILSAVVLRPLVPF